MNIGLFGFGCVGQGLFYALQHSAGFTADIKKIVVKDRIKKRSMDERYFSFNKEDILADATINVVIELIDDADEAFTIVKAAIKSGKHVVTANKKMLALHLEELLQLRNEYNVSLLYEASACGSIPIIRTLEEYFDNEPLKDIKGVFNGTTNYMLTAITKNGISYDQALSEAQSAGFAESDPTSDVEGFDAMYKTVIIALHGFGIILQPQHMLRVGINNLKLTDMEYARRNNFDIKLVPSITQLNEKSIAAFVLPSFVKKESHLHKIENEYNGVLINGLFSGEQFFLGRGAGSYPTGAAVLSDVSALSYGYAYENKKLKQNNHFIFTNELLIKVYLSSENIEDLRKIGLQEIIDSSEVAGSAFLSGKITVAALKEQLSFIENRKIFVAYFIE